MMFSMEEIWGQYGMDGLQQKLDALFGQSRVSLWEMFERILSGDVLGAVTDTISGAVNGMAEHVQSVKNVFIWLLVLGITAALISHFIEIFDSHQVADIGFYFTYLLISAVLLKCFLSSAATAAQTLNRIVEFVRIFVPAYFLSVGVATGTLTAAAGYQIILLLIYLVEHVLLTLILPFIYSYVLLAVVNGLWIEEKLAMLVDGMEKAIRFLLKASLGLVTGASAFQSMITPAIDSVKTTTMQKAVSAIPGVGDVADGVVEVVLGSAVVIKNSMGLVFLLLLLALAAAPLAEIFLTGVLLKAAAAFLGIVSDKRVTACTDKVGNGSRLLCRTVGTAVLLFLIAVSVAAYTTNRGF